MFPHLQISNRWERLAVGVTDWVLGGVAALERLFHLDAVGLPQRRYVPPPKRILILRLERIGDLLMTLDAIAAVRALAPSAEIDLVVGSWNEPLARLIPGIAHVRTLNAPWLAREGNGEQLGSMVRRAKREWLPRNYDVAINFEGDFRSHFLMRYTRAPVRIGFDMAGGGPLLTHRVPFDPTRHTAENALALVAAAAPLLRAVGVDPTAADQRGPTTLALATAAPARIARDPSVEIPTTPSLSATLRVPEDALARAGQRLAEAGGRTLIGLHASGGREIKQWPPERFGEAVGQLASETGAAVLLTGAAGDRAVVGRARAVLPPGVPVVDAVGTASLVDLAALLAHCRLYVTGDTGPMHLAAAVGTPVVAVFGPSDPRRYAPLVARRRVLQIHDTLPCAPCNQIRRPPERCRGIVPDCLSGLAARLVYDAARALWDEVPREGEGAP